MCKFYQVIIASVMICLPTFVGWCGFPYAFAEEASKSGAEEKDSSESALPIENLEKGIKELDEKIRLAKLAENEETAAQLGVSLSDIEERTRKLQQAQFFRQQTLTLMKEGALQQKDLISVREKLDAQDQTGLLEKPPYDLGFYDRLLGKLASSEQKAEAVGLAISLSEKSVKEAEEDLEKQEKKWRSIQDAGQSEEVRGAGNWQKEMVRLDRDVAEAMLLYHETNLGNFNREGLIAQLHTTLYEKQVPWVRRHLQIDEGELEKALKDLDVKRSELEDRLQKLSAEEEPVKAAWLKAREKLENSANEDERLALETKFKERDAWKETYEEALKQTEAMLLLTTGHEDVLRKRYEVLSSTADHETLRAWKDMFEDRVAKLSRLVMSNQGFQASLQAEIASLEKRMTEGNLEPKAMLHIKSRLKAMHKLAENRNLFMSDLLENQQQFRHFLDDIGIELSEVSFKDKFTLITKGFQSVWGFEIWVIDDNAVTVKKVVVAICIFVIGILVVRFLVKHISRRLAAKARLHATTASAIQKTVSYFAYVILVLFTLRMVNIPLGIFTFLGGAIAIGVGFGAQALINNFISGFIILTERPISIGDLIEVEGIVGKVEEIGARCTRVRTGQNIRILVPNSSFLEKNITNWTHRGDYKLRSYVTIGVAYGSPTEEVQRLLLEAVGAIKNVEAQPQPFVLFDDFGDNALVFSVYFWIIVTQNLERRKIESALRFRIDKLFREAGIVIAFPQRDVHIDTTRPLEFRVVKDSSQKSGVSNQESELNRQEIGI